MSRRSHFVRRDTVQHDPQSENVLDILGFNPFPNSRQLKQKMDFFYHPYNKVYNLQQHMDFESDQLI